MTNYESKVTVNQPKAKIFEQLADMRNLEKYKEAFPQGFIGEMEFSQDYIIAKSLQFGEVTLRLTEKEEQTKLKFSLENFPVNANFFVQLEEVQPEKTQIKLILEVDIPFFARPMVDGKMQSGLDKAAEMIAKTLNK